ncbi:MAG: hypothetical protein ACK5JD_10960 [Mangrovibacterium sp.]
MRTLPKHITEQRNKTRYHIHFNLRKKGHTVITSERVVIKHNHSLSEAEERWIRKLYAMGYGITTSLFE